MSTIEQTNGQTVQRVKVGMTGLALVVLLIGLASAIFSSASKEKPVEVIGAPKAEVVANMTMENTIDPAVEAAKEPLAELGVAPGASTDNNETAPVTDSAQPPPAPPGAKK